MLKLRDRPIRQKITLVIMMIASVVLLLAFAALFCFQAYTLKQHSAHELAVVGEITAHNCAAAVMFKDEDAAAQILGGLRTMPQIVSARLELADQQQLAFFGTPRDETQIKAARLESGFRIDGDRILLAQPVMASGAREGTLYLLADLHATTSQLLKLYGGIFALVLVASLLVAFILSNQFLHLITTPILRLAGTARTIADHNDYSVRAAKVCGDEVGVLTDAFNQMLAQIQSQDTALRENENKLAQAQAIAHLGYWERDLITDRLMWSSETNRVFGLSPEEDVNNFARFQELIYPEDRDMVMQAIGVALRGGPRYEVEYRVVWPSGEVRFVYSQGDVILDEAGQPRRMFGTVQDVTERKLVDEVKRASKAKSEFLSRMSHELRTPLNAILGFGQLLERQKPTEVQRKRVGYILSAGKHLLDLINEVLDISRIEAGRMQLSLEPVCVADALEETLDLMRPLATERSIQLSASADIDAGVHVLADRQRFKQVLVNLLNNAVKYTPFFGGVAVSYHVPGNEKVRVLVSDTGPGIPAEKLARLFTPFERLGAEQSAIEGTGLGLALSQRLMDAMGGSIGVESAVGKGSTFWIELPLAKSPLERFPRDGAANGARQPSSEPASRSILYIEDNLSNLALIEQMLAERPGTALLTCMQGKVGLDLARQHTPDLILLDLHLPDLPGWDVLSQLKADSTTRHIPVVVISADATKRQMNRLMSAGAAHYLTKPLDVNKFFQVLDETNGIDSVEQSPAAAISNGDVKEACPSP
ncbi:MAG: hypothetical protein DMF18_02890 [Verrucomicrobia bacterium]|nr:MAG: hypothetical protein DME73_06140 [Verrucomicrobiota bacterium]PYL97341.1 MAG: hypothetical protein DMF18_02890 [Verrucomicrobiota bacterium]